MNEGRAHVLVSYAYYKSFDLDEFFGKFPEKPRVFADSGAFTAFHSGGRVNVKEYAAWLTRWKHHFSVMANLDVIGFGDATVEEGFRNLGFLEKAGLPVIPVYHGGESMQVFERMLARGYDYIAIGGAARKHPAITAPWLVQCFQRAEGKAVLHGFGTTWHKILFMFPWYSVDSSTWANGRRYGELRLFDYRTGKWVQAASGRTGTKRLYENASLIREHGVEPSSVLTHSAGYSDHAMTEMHGVAWKRCELWLRSHRPPVSRPGKDDVATGDDGPFVYLALSSDKTASYLLANAVHRHSLTNPYVRDRR